MSPQTSKLAVLAEEFGEVARAILERDEVNLREELVQVAAVTIAWLEDFELQDEHTWGVGGSDK